jgi:hypothetical protein
MGRRIGFATISTYDGWMTETMLADRWIDLGFVERTPLETENFPYLIVPGFVPESARAALSADYPKIDRPGSFPTGDLQFGPAFRDFLGALEGPAMRDVFARKFDMDLTGRPTMVTVRGQAQPKDGSIHTDSATKLITVLIYMNDGWDEPDGRLRLLRSGDLADYAVEVPPAAGTLIVFRRSDRSYHGHTSFEGERKVIQLNWVTDQRVADRELGRHRFSARLKKLFSFAGA